MPTRPNRPKMRHRTIRVPDDEWEAFVLAAEANGETASNVARRMFRIYARTGQPRYDKSAPPSEQEGGAL